MFLRTAKLDYFVLIHAPQRGHDTQSKDCTKMLFIFVFLSKYYCKKMIFVISCCCCEDKLTAKKLDYDKRKSY